MGATRRVRQQRAEAPHHRHCLSRLNHAAVIVDDDSDRSVPTVLESHDAPRQGKPRGKVVAAHGLAAKIKTIVTSNVVYGDVEESIAARVPEFEPTHDVL